MKTEEILKGHFPELNEEDLKTAARRREEYSLGRDLQAKEYNEAITSRLAKDRENQELGQDEGGKLIKCEKCDKEFLVRVSAKGFMNCPECNRIIEFR